MIENNQKDLKDYENIFKSMNKQKEFEVNIDLIKSLIGTKNKIAELESYPLIRVNKNNPAIQKQTEAAKLIVKLKKIELEQTKLINKILGISLASNSKAKPSNTPINFVEDFKNEFGMT